jgi:seryl-tRNA synthetase
MNIDKSINKLIDSLQKLKNLDLSTSKETDLEKIISIQEQIKLTQKLTSAFQQELSPLQKDINRKRVEMLKKKGKDPANKTKAELIQELEQLKLKLGSIPKEE